jgi:hypothetical protein
MSDLIIDMYGKYLKININTEEYPIVTSLFKIMVEASLSLETKHKFIF